MARVRRGKEFWKKLAREVRGGPGSVAEVAGRYGVSAKYLSCWLWKLRRDGELPKGRSRARMLPVVVERTAANWQPSQVEIAVGAASIRALVGTDVEYIAALARAIGRQC